MKMDHELDVTNCLMKILWENRCKNCNHSPKGTTEYDCDFGFSGMEVKWISACHSGKQQFMLLCEYYTKRR